MGKSFLFWLMANKGKGLSKDFVCYSGKKHGSIDDIQETLAEKGMIKTEDID
jgi:hypothetical protein